MRLALSGDTKAVLAQALTFYAPSTYSACLWLCRERHQGERLHFPARGAATSGSKNNSPLTLAGEGPVERVATPTLRLEKKCTRLNRNRSKVAFAPEGYRSGNLS